PPGGPKPRAQRLAPRARRDLWRWVFDGPIRTQHAKGAETHAAQQLKQAIETGQFEQAAPTPVSLVGAGPGGRDLITLRGVKRLQEADIIYYDRLVDPDILELARRDAERVYVGKAPGCHSWPQDKINQTLVSAAKRGLRVVRLKCGDPGIFARGAEEAAALREAGIEYEIVPGVTAASGAAAAIGGFLTERDAIRNLVFTTATLSDGTNKYGWIDHLTSDTTIAVYMGVKAAHDIQQALIDKGIAAMTRVTIVSNAQTDAQYVTTCQGDTLVRCMQDNTVSNPAIIFLKTGDMDVSKHHNFARLS
ncbi:MAG: uroporphyrinogen-III C-methyltransferase, partial [Pseudomonadota bacterium]